MILRFRNTRPAISFGLGKFEKTVLVGQAVDVYLQQAYDEQYVIAISSEPIMPNAKINSNLFRVTPSSAGDYVITVFVTNKDKSIQKYSNSLTLSVHEE